MAANALRSPTQTVEPVANTTAGVWTFSPGARSLTVSNRSGATVYLRFNGGAATTAADGHDLSLSSNEHEVLHGAVIGVGTFETVSAWFPDGATVTALTLRGT